MNRHVLYLLIFLQFNTVVVGRSPVSYKSISIPNRKHGKMFRSREKCIQKSCNYCRNALSKYLQLNWLYALEDNAVLIDDNMQTIIVSLKGETLLEMSQKEFDGTSLFKLHLKCRNVIRLLMNWWHGYLHKSRHLCT